MTTTRKISLLILLMLASAAVSAEQLSQVVGAEGDLQTLSAGLYGELFPDGTAAASDASVLVLDCKSSETSERFLVPTTESPWSEDSATLLYDAGASVTYLLWAAPFNGIHPMLYFTSFDGENWGEVLEIMGTIFAPKLDLRLVVSRDSHLRQEAQAIERTAIHVGWSEQRASGVEKKYTALILENGAYVGRNPSLDLGSLLGVSENVVPVDSSLESALVMQTGNLDSSLVAGFYSGRTGELHSLRVEVLPMALSILAAEVEAAAAAWEPGGEQDLMAVVEQALALHGGAFHDVVLALVAEDVRSLIESWDGDDIRSLVDKFGPRVIHIGMKVGSNGLESPDAELILTILPEADPVSPRHDLKLSTLGRWNVPEDVGVETRFLLSRDGRDALIAWQLEDEQAVLYRETLSDGTWSDARRLALDSNLSIDAALGILGDHIRDR